MNDEGTERGRRLRVGVFVLIGLAANSLFGWWWMDPIAGLGVALLAIKEGREAWSSGELCGGHTD